MHDTSYVSKDFSGLLGDNITIIFGLLLVAVLLGLNALFVAAEFAYISVRRTQMQNLADDGNRSAKRILGAISNLDFYVAASQLGITMATIALGFLGEPVIAGLIEPPIERFVGSFAPAIAHSLAIATAFLLVTVMHIVFGEFAPKTIALQQSGKTAMWISLPMEIFVRIFRPFIWLLNTTGNTALKLVGYDVRPVGDEPLRPEDLALTLESSASAGLISRRELDLSRNTLRLNTLQVSDLMVPRTEVVGIPLDAQRQDIVRTFATHRFTRYPVYNEQIDSVVGFIDAKQVVYDLPASDANWHDDIQEPLIVPESITIEQALTEARVRKQSLIIAVDEFGGMAGILSLSDVIEFLAGHMPDEHETSEDRLRYNADGSVIAPGLLHLVELEDELSITVPDVESHTIGGMIMEMTGRIPEAGDEVAIDSYTVRVTTMDNNRVNEVLLIPSNTNTGSRNER
jgi:putative hemolysin